MSEKILSTIEKYTQASVDAALQESATTTAELPFDPDFQAYLQSRRIDLDDTDPSRYWAAVAEYTALETAPRISGTDLKTDSRLLVANLPAFLTDQYALGVNSPALDKNQRRNAKQTTAAYNGMLVDFVRHYPQQYEALSSHLLSATLEIMGSDSDEFLRQAEKDIEAKLRGVRHEYGFSRILDELGVSYREATVAEDLKGRDLVISFNGQEIGVDVKASLTEVDAKNNGSNGSPIAHKYSGDLVMFSMLQDSDFRGGFEPDPARLAEIAPFAGALLQKAILESLAKT